MTPVDESNLPLGWWYEKLVVRQHPVSGASRADEWASLLVERWSESSTEEGATVKRWTKVVAIATLIIALIAVWTIVRQARAKPPEGVLEASGRIEGEEVLIASKVGGRLTRLLVRDGDAVKAGQLVAVLQAPELDARLRQAASGIETAGAQVRIAEGELAVLGSQLGQAGAAVALAQVQVTAQQRQAQASLTGSLARLAQARKALTIARRTAPHTVHAAQAAVGAADADLVRARAAQRQAKREVTRLDALLEAGAVSVAQADAARAGLDAASAQVAAAAEQVQRAQAALEQAKTAPLDVQLREEEIRAAVAAVDAARSQVTLAQMGAFEVTRQRQLLQSVERQTQVARAGLAAARATYQAAVAARDELASVRQETRVFAPQTGVVAHRVANQGEVVAPGAPIVVLVDLRALWLKVYVPEPDVAKIGLGAAAALYVDAYPGRAFAATVTEISDRAEFTPKDVQTREERMKQVFAVKLAVTNQDGVLKPGMPADVAISEH